MGRLTSAGQGVGLRFSGVTICLHRRRDGQERGPEIANMRLSRVTAGVEVCYAKPPARRARADGGGVPLQLADDSRLTEHRLPCGASLARGVSVSHDQLDCVSIL
jgi:hypothetical protein